MDNYKLCTIMSWDHRESFNENYINELSEALKKITDLGIFPKIVNVETDGDFTMIITPRSQLKNKTEINKAYEFLMNEDDEDDEDE